MKTSQWTSKPLQQKSNLTSSGTSPTFSPCEFGGHRDPGVFLGSWETQTEKLVVPTPKKLTCHLKSDHFKVNFIFQPSIFNKCGTVVFMGGNDSETRLSFFFPISFSCGFQVCIPSLIAPYLASSSRVGNHQRTAAAHEKGTSVVWLNGLSWAALNSRSCWKDSPAKQTSLLTQVHKGKKHITLQRTIIYISHLWKRKIISRICCKRITVVSKDGIKYHWFPEIIHESCGTSKNRGPNFCFHLSASHPLQKEPLAPVEMVD